MSKKKRKQAMSPEVAQAVTERAKGSCEAMIRDAGCTGSVDHLHHRKLRSQGGKHEVPNLVGICHMCHHWIHMHPAISYTHGWIVKSTKDPQTVPFVLRGRAAFLTPVGQAVLVETEETSWPL